MHCSLPKSFSVSPGRVYLGISPGAVCLGYFIAPAQLKVLGFPRSVLRIVEQEGTGFLGERDPTVWFYPWDPFWENALLLSGITHLHGCLGTSILLVLDIPNMIIPGSVAFPWLHSTAP